MQIITRKEAISKSLKFYFTGKPCVNGHKSKRYSKSGKCYKCSSMYARKYFSQMTDNEKKKKREYMESYNEEYRLLNRDKILDIKRRFYRKNSDRLLAKAKSYRDENRHKYVRLCRERRIKIKGATPSWLNEEQKRQIDNIYRECAMLNSKDKASNHVDHIIPINSDYVCGLHVPWNLQILSAKDNVQKSNRVIDV